MTIVDVQDLHVSLGEKEILNGVNLKLNPGELVSLVGSNGAGKTTLLKTLTGMVKYTQGSVRVLEYDLKNPTRSGLKKLRLNVGQIFQNLHLVSRLTALENVLIGRLGHNRSPLTWLRIYTKSDLEIAHSALESVGLWRFADQRVDQLSGGERQKVAIARVLAQGAKLVLADEPTANLDPHAAIEIAELLNKMSRQGLAVMTTVHSVSLLASLGGRVIGLKSGQIQFTSAFKDVSESNLRELYRDEVQA